MNKEELLEAIEQKRQEIWPTDTGEMKPATVPNNFESGWLNALTWMKRYINSLPAEQQSNSLDNFIQSLLETYPTNKNEVPKEALNDYHQGLICGARKTYNWILESAIKIDAKIVNDEMSGCVVDCEQGCLVLEPHTYPIGQQLKILIIKEDENG